MPNLKNAHKALRQSKVHAIRNAKRVNVVDALTRQFRKLLEGGKADEAKALVGNIYQSLDKAAGKRVMSKNAAARTKSRMMTRLKKVEGRK